MKLKNTKFKDLKIVNGINFYDQRGFFREISKAKLFISLEDGSIKGGAGSSVQEFCAEENIIIKSKLLGIPDKFIDHASREEMIDEVGLTAKQIEETLQQWI